MKTVRALLCPSTEHTKYCNYDSAGEMACVALNDIEASLAQHDGDPGPLYPLPDRVDAVLKAFAQRVVLAELMASSKRPQEWWEE